MKMSYWNGSKWSKGTLDASVLGTLLTGQGINKAGKGNGINRRGEGIVRAGYGSKMDF